MSTRTQAPSNLVAFPSVSQALHTLPRCTSMQNVALHPHMYAQRQSESEAKLQKALSKTASTQSKQSAPVTPYNLPPSQGNAGSDDAALMMRKPQKGKH
ncbi:hypothetical protein AX16_005091 [Volvariella volvacea WC 439]|nr:hypothetical protein AX16_005091 [Volvariella volvacea WC 439]